MHNYDISEHLYGAALQRHTHFYTHKHLLPFIFVSIFHSTYALLIKLARLGKDTFPSCLFQPAPGMFQHETKYF